MKKIVLGCLFLISAGVYADDVPEIPVYGWWPQQGFSSLSSGVVQPFTMPGIMYGTTYSSAAHAAMVAAQKAAKKAECEAKASQTEQSCKTAYNDLSNYCQAFNILAGGTAVGSFKLLYAKLAGAALDSGVSYAVSTGAAAAGVSEQDILVPCSDLTAKAMSYCEAGAAKMKESCKNIQ